MGINEETVKIQGELGKVLDKLEDKGRELAKLNKEIAELQQDAQAFSQKLEQLLQEKTEQLRKAS